MAPTEPRVFKGMGRLSTRPEDSGVDFMWHVKWARAFAGVQRKEVSDFVASLRDGRLVKEVGQWVGLCNVMLLIEGPTEIVGDMVTVPGNDRVRISRAEWQGVIWKAQELGAKVSSTWNHAESVETILAFQEWTRHERHSSLTTRPSANVTSKWGRPSSREFGVHLLQSFPGIGAELAGRIYDVRAEVPLAWTMTEEEMLAVPGLGKAKVEKLLAALPDWAKERLEERDPDTRTRSDDSPGLSLVPSSSDLETPA